MKRLIGSIVLMGIGAFIVGYALGYPALSPPAILIGVVGAAVMVLAFALAPTE